MSLSSEQIHSAIDTTWGQIVSLEYGKGIRGYDQIKEGNFRVYGTNGPIGWWNTSITDGPTVIVGRKGAYRGVHYSPFPCFVIDTAFYVKPKIKLDLRWVYYRLLQEDINSMDSGSAIPSTSREEFYHLAVSVPPYVEQKRIADILSTLDAKIESNLREGTLLENLAQTLFKSWFVDFDPVFAKSEGRKPFGMSDEIAALFPDSFEESELGAVPKGWETSAASDLLSILSGGTPKTSVNDYWDGSIPWFSVVDTPAPGEVFVLDTEKKITELGVQRSAATIYPAGTTIITARGTVGNVAMMGQPMAFNQSCYGLQGKGYFDGTYTFFLAKHIVEELKLIAHGSVFDTITRDSFDSIKVCKPPRSVLERFSAAVVPMLEKIKATVQESRTLQAMRNALLPQLLSGEIAIEKEMITQVSEATAA
jgi:type I restriction enzyme S subunit